MEIIVPAAGLSTRYRSPKPKYLLFDADGELMLSRAVAPFLNRFDITVGILQEHNDAFAVEQLIRSQIPRVRVVILPTRTQGPADTVYQIVKSAGITGEIFIKDCDSFFDYDYRPGNSVATIDVKDYEVVRQLAAKSFVVKNDQNIILDIVEKQVISDTVCVGGYQIADADGYCARFDALKERSSEIFVSHVIQDMIAGGEIFINSPVKDWVDVGTIDEWIVYNNQKLGK